MNEVLKMKFYFDESPDSPKGIQIMEKPATFATYILKPKMPIAQQIKGLRRNRRCHRKLSLVSQLFNITSMKND
ncbi:hypothetical protein BH10BAC2_BH10BAC2_43520 [soil metagenome]